VRNAEKYHLLKDVEYISLDDEFLYVDYEVDNSKVEKKNTNFECTASLRKISRKGKLLN
jgi:hypothetical protein